MWKEELEILKSIIQKTTLVETTKWRTAVYTHNGKNVVGLVGFKNFFTLWFYNGVFLKDKYNVLINAQEGKTKAMRQWRFTSKNELDEPKILAYLNEAIRNEEEGKIWKPEKSKQPDVPELMKIHFEKNKELKTAFSKLTPYKQKEYIEHIQTAKKIETQIARIEKIIPLILQGVGLHDKYKK
jgi:uncharacterized protein YdeI (YjbR/CyaY-like superfamily)